jgi:hypothetical protein
MQALGAGARPVMENGMPIGVLAQLDVARGLELMELAATQHPPPSRPRGLSSAEQHG